MNIRSYRVLMIAFVAVSIALMGFAPSTSAAGKEKRIAALSVRLGEHKKLRVEVNKKATKDEVAYVDIEASKRANPRPLILDTPRMRGRVGS